MTREHRIARNSRVRVRAKWLVGTLIFMFLIGGCRKGDDTRIDPAKLQAAKQQIAVQAQPEQGSTRGDDAAYVTKTTPVLDTLIHLESDLQAGIVYEDYVHRMADLNFVINKITPTLTERERARQSMTTMLAAVDEFREARGWWDLERLPMMPDLNNSGSTADGAVRTSNARLEYLNEKVRRAANKQEHWDKAVALVQLAQQQMQEGK